LDPAESVHHRKKVGLVHTLSRGLLCCFLSARTEFTDPPEFPPYPFHLHGHYYPMVYVYYINQALSCPKESSGLPTLPYDIFLSSQLIFK
jgi:hypothetical protein